MRSLAVATVTLMATGPLIAQQTNQAVPLERGSIISPVLTIDSERVFLESAFGLRLVSEVEARGAALSAENRRIEAELEAEELALTEKRPTITPEEFRALADAFDQKVQNTRKAQTAKGRAINEELDQAREIFLAAAAPVLEQLMREAGAAVILERRSAFVIASAVDITDEAIDLIDQTLGTGE